MNAPPDLTIAVLLPDVLGTYSDAANAIVLAQRARWRGIGARIVHVTADTTPPASCDFYLLGGGEDAAQSFAIDWLSRHRDLRHAMGDGPAVTFGVCAGLQILGRTLTDLHGCRRDGLGLLDVTTSPGGSRTVGEVVSRCVIPGVGLLTGFANHRGITTLGGGARPLGRVLSGAGNNGRGKGTDGSEGAVGDNVVATYLHGPVLARNPALADNLLQRATGFRLTDTAAPDVPDLPNLRDTYLARSRRRLSTRFMTRTARR